MLQSKDTSDITVCIVLQNCCNGCSKKYRKWQFWGCSLSESLQQIDIKFDTDDYVGDGNQYAKWRINRFRGVISTKGWNVNGLCFLSTHADRHVVDISFTVCFFVCFFVRRIFVTDISGAGGRTAVKLWRMVDLGVCQVFSHFCELWPRG